MAGRRFTVTQPTMKKSALHEHRKKTHSNRVRQSTKALALFWLTPTRAEQPSTPPFCPDEPTEAMRAPRDAVANFYPWRTW